MIEMEEQAEQERTMNKIIPLCCRTASDTAALTWEQREYKRD